MKGDPVGFRLFQPICTFFGSRVTEWFNKYLCVVRRRFRNAKFTSWIKTMYAQISGNALPPFLMDFNKLSVHVHVRRPIV